jgi:hypothetical protein
MKRKILRCEDSSPIYRQILKEKLQGYKFMPCNKTKRIIKIK